MPRKKSIVNVEAQRVRLQNELSHQYRAAQERYFNGGQNAADLKRMETVARRSATVNRIANRYDKNIRRATGVSDTVNSFYGDRRLITQKVSRRTYIGLANG